MVDKAKPGTKSEGLERKGTNTKTIAKVEPTARDRIIVTNEALATIIGLAAHEVPGVVGMAPANIREGLKRILGVQQVDEGVVVTRPEDSAPISVDIHVVVAYGVNIPVVADLVRDRVMYAAKNFGGIDLGRVCLHVAGVSRD